MTSTIKVNNIQNQCGANIINENSNTITIGASGDTVSLASGASQTGFGRTGTVDWQTSIKTAATFSASNGEGYFVDTSSNAVTANLPAGSVGAIVSFKDYAQNFDTNALTIAANGSEKIEGLTDDLVLETEGLGVTLVYGDATKGWQAVNSNEITNAASFIQATGGTVTTVCTNFKVHTFTGPGSFCVSNGGSPGGSNTVSYMVVGGGGSGGPANHAGGGGAGGFRESRSADDSYTASPLNATSGPTYNLPVTAQAYPITVGAGGSAPTSPGTNGVGAKGSNSQFSSITSAGGGGGASDICQSSPNYSGGSGGGMRSTCGTSYEGSGNTPPVSPPQGTNGGAIPGSPNGPAYGAGGGGGATSAGGTGTPSVAGAGGTGATTVISGTPTAYAGGGGGSKYQPTGGAGGAGGTGGGGAGGAHNGNAAVSGTANTGGGGGGAERGTPSNNGGNGGSGVVIIRYKFQ